MDITNAWSFRRLRELFEGISHRQIIIDESTYPLPHAYRPNYHRSLGHQHGLPRGGNAGARVDGFDGGFFDGRFVNFVPFAFGSKSEGYIFHSNFLRYDPRGDFKDPESWDAHDASKASKLDAVGYNAGAFDGRYFYYAPWRREAWDGKNWRTKPNVPGIHGTILRYDDLLQFSNTAHHQWH